MSVMLGLRVSCRACNRECGDYKHLMDETVVDNEKTTLAALLNYCTNLEIKARDASNEEDAKLPEHICNSCVEHLIQAFLFKEMVLETDRNLRAANTQEKSQVNSIPEAENADDKFQKADIEMETELETDLLLEIPEEVVTTTIASDETTMLLEQPGLNSLNSNDDNNKIHNNHVANIETESPYSNHEVVIEIESEEPVETNVMQDELVLIDNVVVDGTVVTDDGGDIIYAMEEWLEMDENETETQIIETLDNHGPESAELSYVEQNQADNNDYDSDETLLVEEECDVPLTKTVSGECLLELQGSNYIHSDKENSNMDQCLSEFIEQAEFTDEEGGEEEEEEELGEEEEEEMGEEEVVEEEEDIAFLETEIENMKNNVTAEETSNIKKVVRRSLKVGNLTREDLTCKYCGKEFDKLCRMREHVYMHTGEKPHVCTICGKRSRTKTHHNVHMLIHSEDKRYKCKICGQDYRTSNSLRVHERKHSNIKPFKCHLCEKTFHTAEQRKLHIMLHTGERPFSCDKCGKAYRESHSLRQHLRSHDNKKPFQCEVCGKGLTQMSGYKRHMLLHTGEYPFKCDVCGRAFRISSNLLTHKRLHLDVLPFQCNICSKGFTTTTRLKHHMQQHERNVQAKERREKAGKKRAEAPSHNQQKMAKSRVVEII